MARFATVPYEEPTSQNCTNMFLHLTNYAINKTAANYIPNETADGTGISHKRSLKAIYEIIDKMGQSSERLKSSIDDLIIKTIIAGGPEMAHVYKSCQPEDYENSLCFQILGFDVMFDQNFKPWLLEVNHAPSFATESAFDQNLKFDLLTNTFKLLNLQPKKKRLFMANQRLLYQKRILTGKLQKLSYEEKELKRKEHDLKRTKQEQELLGRYRLIFP